MENGVGSSTSNARRLRYFLAVVGAVLVSLAAALPVFAQEEPTTGNDQQVQPQVVGGTAVPDGKYPFMTSLQADTSRAKPYREHFCGASLIDRDSVLTAAHCVDFIGVANTPTTLSYRDLRIVVGLTELNSRQGEARRIDSLSDIRIHPRYNGRTDSRYDAAVIELANPVRFAPIPLAAASSGDALERGGRLATVAGWGNVRKQGTDFSQPDSFPNRMREARPPIVSDRRAEAVYKDQYFPPLMVAAGKEGVDTCQGDSGGPMWVTTNGGRRQIGITSFGEGCAARGYPGVYTEVNAPSIRDFITQAAGL